MERADWEGCLDSGNPFVSYDFLRILEESGSAVPETGWEPVHLGLEQEGRLVGVAPTYLKSHSYGEFMFDWGWAQACERAGGRYYPKLQVAVPFSPIPGPRLLAETPELRLQLAQGLKSLAGDLQASSVHLTFCQREESSLPGYFQRLGIQFHWTNRGYRDFDDFLAAFTSRRRKTVRRERREALRPGMQLEVLTGDDLQERHWDAFYPLYTGTYDRKWGSPHLTRPFFSLLGERMSGRVLLLMVFEQGRAIAGALNLIGRDALYGRNWGSRGDFPFLHFELCYYQAVEFAIRRGLSRVEAGVQGPHKLARGYLPVQTFGACWFADPAFGQAISACLCSERSRVRSEEGLLARDSPFRREGMPGRV